MFEKMKRLFGKKEIGGEPPSGAVRGKTVSALLDENIKLMEALFTDVDTMLNRQFENAERPEIRFCIYYSDGVADAMLINEHVIKPLIQMEGLRPGPQLFDEIKDRVILINEVKESSDIAEIVSGITYGDTVLFLDGADRALLFNSKKFSLRSSTEPEGERVLSGPREGFTEGIMNNLSMLRRRMRSSELKIKFFNKGRLTRTTVCVVYIESVVNKNILKELYRRLEGIDIDGVLDPNYLEEFIGEQSAFGFNSLGATERPDVVVAKMLEGRIAVLVDGSPVALTAPYLFVENFQSNEDYYMPPVYASFSRIIRIICFILTISVPAIYISIVAYHHEILPSAFMISLAKSRARVPLPAALECFIMLIMFDILRETGIRMPNHIGQAMSIVGALVIGQAAVEAHLVAAPMVIVVAFTGITNLMSSRLTAATLVSRYFCLILASMIGLTGLMVGISSVLIHVLSMETLGIPSILPVKRLEYQEVKDTFIRAPWPNMLKRIWPLSHNLTRQKKVTH